MRPGRLRLLLFALLIAGMFVAIGVRMQKMLIVDNQYYLAQAESKRTKTITLTGMRGKILDANMNPLAYDRQCYNVQFYRDPSRSTNSDRKAYTRAIIDVINIIEGNGRKTIDGLWLKKNPDTGVWYFDTGADKEEVAAARIKQWRSNFLVNSEKTYPTEKLFDILCENYQIPKELPEEEKIKVLTIWQEQRMNNFLSRPVTIAYDVGFETVSEIEVKSNELPGISIVEASERVYPKGSLAAHLIGYISRISGDKNLEDYLAKSYGRDALVGMSGIEASMEDQLTPCIEYRQGKQVVEINAGGKIIRQISYEQPVSGNSVVLTLDSKLQSVAETALEANIEKIRALQEKTIATDRWQKDNAATLAEYAKQGKTVATAQSGALVAMDPQSGAVLAMVSNPGYDLSMFTGTVDQTAVNALLSDPRNPMYNRAIMARDTPGSIFKLVTALGGLMEGKLTLDERISDEGPFKLTDVANPPSCWIAPSLRWTHAEQTVVQGIAHSCNYFFFTVGYRMGSTLLTKWAAQLGLTSRTGIELNNEAISFVGNQDKLYDENRAIDDQFTSKPLFVAATIKSALKRIGQDRQIQYDDDRLDRVTKKLLDLVIVEGTKDAWIPLIRDILVTDMNLPVEYISKNFLVNEFYNYIKDLRWTPNETIMAAIGQSITQVTPIAVARYVSAVANGGTVYNAQLIDKIISPTGSIVLEKKPVITNKIEGAEEYLKAIREGMQDVTSVENDGTAANEFKNNKYKIAAKTGTAERTDLDIENNSWLVCYAPLEDPKIVVVVYIPNGYAGLHSSYAAKAVINAYLDELAEKQSTTVSGDNSLAD